MASAEEYTKAYGMKEFGIGRQKSSASIQPVLPQWLEEIRPGSWSFQKEETEQTSRFVSLSGGGANLPGLAEELTKFLGIESPGDQPFNKIETSKVVAPFDLTCRGCGLHLAIGLALRGAG